METKALWHLSESCTVLKTAEIEPRNHSCLIKSLYSLISTGTERLIAQGKVPEELHKAMKVPYMQGSFNFPLTYGYSIVGEIIEGPESLTGNFVHIMHPHQSYFYAHKKDFTVLPEGFPVRRAILASNLETVINAIWDGKVMLGEKILVIGFGIIGALLCQVLSTFPAMKPVVLEKNKFRCKKAQSMGFDVITSPSEPKASYDLAFNTSGHEDALQICIDHVGYEGKVVELSWYGNQNININLGSSFHHLRKKIISSQVSQIPGHMRNRWDHNRRKRLVIDMLNDARFDELLSEEIDFDDSPEFFQRLRKRPVDPIATIIKY